MILLIIIIVGCQTIEYVTPDYVLPPEPKREMIDKNLSLPDDYPYLIIYYESLVQAWELWAKDVKKIIGKE